MRLVSEEKLATLLASLPGEPRVVVSGNFATPWRALRILDAHVERYRLYEHSTQRCSNVSFASRR